jgi:translation elongation factor EF-4
MKKANSNIITPGSTLQIDDCLKSILIAIEDPQAPEGHRLARVRIASVFDPCTGLLVTVALSDSPNLDAGAVRTMVAHNDGAGLPSTGFHFENGTWTKEAR